MSSPRTFHFAAAVSICVVAAAILLVGPWLSFWHTERTGLLDIWIMRFGGALGAGFVTWVTFRQLWHQRNSAAGEPERYPNLLATLQMPTFDANGLNFTFVPEVIEGTLSMTLYFQSRYEHECQAIVYINRPDGDLSTYYFNCPGGAGGRVRKAVPLPSHLRGAQISSRVTADVSFPNSKGAMVRHDRGAPCGPRSKVGSRASANLLLSLLTAPFGLFVLGGEDAEFQARLPYDASVLPGQIPDDGNAVILWEPD